MEEEERKEPKVKPRSGRVLVRLVIGRGLAGDEALGRSTQNFAMDLPSRRRVPVRVAVVCGHLVWW